MQEILITGAGSGFGEGSALGMAQKGHSVIVVRRPRYFYD
jgi:NADP-dependent 3-hydroxy acid dehydrogenase YdfG